MAFKFKRTRSPIKIGLPSRPVLSNTETPESLTGQINGFKASAPEERLGRALEKANIQYSFRYTVGAPRGLPGWKELDFAVLHAGMLYAIEVDTAFTHREKAYADVLHDAIVLNDPDLNAAGTMYPQVLHADGDSELANQANANAYVKKLIGR